MLEILCQIAGFTNPVIVHTSYILDLAETRISRNFRVKWRPRLLLPDGPAVLRRPLAGSGRPGNLFPRVSSLLTVGWTIASPPLLRRPPSSAAGARTSGAPRGGGRGALGELAQ